MRITDPTIILQADDLPWEDVECPEWGGSVCIQALTARERDRYETSTVQLGARQGKLTGKVNLRNARARLVAAAARSEPGGKRLFTPDQVEALGEKNAAAVDRLFAVAQRLSGLSAGDIQELVGNFTLGQSDDSTSS